jgi:hypothetical protein
MAPHPKTQTKRERSDTWAMIDAFRKVETDLHHRLLELRTIPPDWDGIFERRRERHPKRVKVTANFDADVVRFFKGLGPGYQWRMNEVLRAYVHGRMAKIVKGPDTTDYILHPERIPEDPRSGTGGRRRRRWHPRPRPRTRRRRGPRRRSRSARRSSVRRWRSGRG